MIVISAFGVTAAPRSLSWLRPGHGDPGRRSSTETQDGAVDRSRGCVAHADVMRDLVGDARSGRQAHQPQILLHLLVVHDFQKRRLFELEGQPLSQRAIENGIAGCVGEVGSTSTSLSVSGLACVRCCQKKTPPAARMSAATAAIPYFNRGFSLRLGYSPDSRIPAAEQPITPRRSRPGQFSGGDAHFEKSYRGESDPR